MSTRIISGMCPINGKEATIETRYIDTNNGQYIKGTSTCSQSIWGPCEMSDSCPIKSKFKEVIRK